MKTFHDITEFRWFMPTLRGLLLLLPLAVIGIAAFTVVNRTALIQRQAVNAIVAAGGTVEYDYEFLKRKNWTPPDHDYESWLVPRGPAWLRMIVGDHFFSYVVRVTLPSDSGTEKLRQLPGLRYLDLSGSRSRTRR